MTHVGIFRWGSSNKTTNGCVDAPAFVRRDEMRERPSWEGRYRMAIEIVNALLEYGFFNLDLHIIVGNTASGNTRVERLAFWFGANIVARRLVRIG
jgi:hypothetical protein